MMDDEMNDFDRIAEKIDEALSEFTGNAHECLMGDDSLSMTRDGFIVGVIRLQRLRDWVEGLAESSRDYQDTNKAKKYTMPPAM